MRFAAALSEHPLATHAVGEVVGDVLERVGPAPDLVLLFVGAAHTGALEDITGAVRTLLAPAVLAGCTAATVVGGEREVADAGGVALWAASGVTATAHRLPGDVPTDGGTLLVLADPFSFDVDDLVRRSTGPVVGGLASAGRGPGGNRLVLDDRILTDGAVAVSITAPTVAAVVSQGCRPVGPPLIVTRADGSLVHELAGQPALTRVRAILDGLHESDRAAARKGLHVGIVLDESKASFGPGDFLIRDVVGGDRATGSVALSADVEVGTTIQLQVRDATTADDELRHLLADRRAEAALLFTCGDRGMRLFGDPDHDAIVVSEAIGARPLAGMSCAGEIGPIGGRSRVHTLTASVALFGS